MADKKSKPKMVTKEENPPKLHTPEQETPLSSVFIDSPGITRALNRAGIVTLEQLNEKANEEIAAINGILFTRYKMIMDKLGRKV